MYKMLSVIRQASKAQQDKSAAEQRNRANSEKKLYGQIRDKYKSDLSEAVPVGIIERGMFRKKYGNPDDVKMRESMLGKAKSRYNRDTDILRTYGADAMRARSFMSAERPATINKEKLVLRKNK